MPWPSVCCTGTLNLLSAIHPRAEHTIRSPAAPPPFSDALKPVDLLLGSPGKEAWIWCSLCWGGRRLLLLSCHKSAFALYVVKLHFFQELQYMSSLRSSLPIICIWLLRAILSEHFKCCGAALTVVWFKITDFITTYIDRHETNLNNQNQSWFALASLSYFFVLGFLLVDDNFYNGKYTVITCPYLRSSTFPHNFDLFYSITK